MRRLLTVLITLLGFTLLAAPPVSAAASVQTENRASGSAAVAEILTQENTRLSTEAVRENIALGYDVASDDAVAARATTRFGPRSVGAAENVRGIVNGNLNKVGSSRLKDLGIDAEAVKRDLVGSAGGRFNLSVDGAGNVFLTPVKRGAGEPVPSFSTLDELSQMFPMGR